MCIICRVIKKRLAITVGGALLAAAISLFGLYGLWDVDGCTLLDIYYPHTATITKKLVHVSGSVVGFYDEYNGHFIRKWKCTTGQTIEIEQSRGASGDQMRAIVAGKLHPDIITMSNPWEMDTIAQKTGIVTTDWRGAFPHQSSPFYSAVVFLVRHGNPRNIKDWGDLTTPGLTLLVSNPKTCGGGRWVYEAALGYGLSESNGDIAMAQKYASQFYKNVPVLYSDQGVARQVFVDQKIGDVNVTYESVAMRVVAWAGTEVDVITPKRTIMIDIPVALAIKNTEQNGTTDIAEAYLNGLYEREAQDLAAKDSLRPRLQETVARSPIHFPDIDLFTRDYVFGTGNTVETENLKNGGIFDRSWDKNHSK